MIATVLATAVIFGFGWFVLRFGRKDTKGKLVEVRSERERPERGCGSDFT